MQVQATKNPLLNLQKQGAPKGSKLSSDNKKDFESVLAMKKPIKKKIKLDKKPHKSSKKKTNHDVADQEQSKQALEKNPKKSVKESHPRHEQKAVLKAQRNPKSEDLNSVKTQKSGLNTLSTIEQPAQNQQLTKDNADSEFSKKLMLTDPLVKDSELSTLQSEATKKTLDLSTKNDINSKKTFSDELFQQDQNGKKISLEALQASVAKQTKPFDQAQQGALNSGIGKTQMLAGNKNSQLKIPKEFNLQDQMETLSASEAMPKSKVLSKDLGDNLSKEDSMNFESQFSQYVEQDKSNLETQSNEFSATIGEVESSQNSQKNVENIQDIIKQARTIVDDGGGSMEIHLQPEGLGKLHLKVAVQDGQVNVEMHTDNMLAKKALEESLVDIKSALEGQKLLVETMKVEMSQDYQKDFSDLQQHMQEQANRDFAEQFLGQFHQERQEKFGGMFDSFRNFQRGPKEPELTLSNRNPYNESGKGRTINLVA